MSASKQNNGFTIIELILFLALTGLFLLIALNGVTGRADNARFSDSMRSLENYMRQQTNDIFTGVNSAGSGDSGDTIILGFMMRFNLGSDLVEVFKIRGARLDTWHPNARVAIYDSLRQYKILYPAAADDIIYETEIYNLKWGSTFIHGQNKANPFETDPNRHTRHWGLIRSPNGTDLIPILLTNGGFDGNLSNPENYSPARNFYTSAISVHACLLGASGHLGELVFSGGNANFNFEVLPEAQNPACDENELFP